MRSRSKILAMALGSCLAAIVNCSSASARLYSFGINPFQDKATLTIAFAGTDVNGDGLLTGFFPSTMGLGFADEITALSVTFSGNALIPAYSASTTDFNSLTQSLVVSPYSGYEVIYVLNSSGSGLAAQGLSPASANGDGFVSLFGSAGLADIGIVGGQCSALGGYAGVVLGPHICGYQSYSAVTALGVPISTTDLAVPEPMSLSLLAGGLVLLAVARRWR